MELEKKTFFLVTGASRGIGRTMAIEFSKQLKPNSLVVLLARNKALLEQTRDLINVASNKQLKVFVYTVDFEDAQVERFQEILKDALNAAQQQDTDFERAFIIHNAGTVGDATKAAVAVSDTKLWTNYMHTNLFATVALNCAFFAQFVKVPKLVVNISSLCGIEPFKSMSYYCTGKAARDMYFRVLAVEQTDSIVLNYAPGAIDTDMTIYLQQESTNTELAEQFKELRATKTMLTTEQTTDKLKKILTECKFKSGDHVDYWD